MASFEFNEIRRESPVFEGSALIIWIWNADKIPPHLGISVGKSYFSLTYKGVEAFQTAAMLRKIKRLQIPMAFVRTKIDIDEDQAAKLFQSFERAKPGGSTCLSPIKELCDSGAGVLQLANLLKELEDSGSISDFHGLNLPPDYSALPEYSWLDIVKRIEQLDAAK